MFKMKSLGIINLILLLASLCASCSSTDDQDNSYTRRNQKGEYIYRKHNESLTMIPPPEKAQPKIYPWNKEQSDNFPKITKEFFKCKGCSLNPCHIAQIKGETVRHYDCSGSDKHSLPLKDDKEFIYPILIDLVNHIQEITGRHVVITCGHRCPEHNTYADHSPSNQYSKHMIGAEVDFYVQGLEEHPEQIVKIIQDFYKTDQRYRGKGEFEFQRYDKTDTDVSTPPWFNKEIFIKLYEKKEGRDFDNRHPYPYLSIQVRYDKESNERVIYSWDKAFRNYRRW